MKPITQDFTLGANHFIAHIAINKRNHFGRFLDTNENLAKHTKSAGELLSVFKHAIHFLEALGFSSENKNRIAKDIGTAVSALAIPHFLVLLSDFPKKAGYALGLKDYGFVWVVFSQDMLELIAMGCNSASFFHPANKTITSAAMVFNAMSDIGNLPRTLISVRFISAISKAFRKEREDSSDENVIAEADAFCRSTRQHEGILILKSVCAFARGAIVLSEMASKKLAVPKAVVSLLNFAVPSLRLLERFHQNYWADCKVTEIARNNL